MKKPASYWRGASACTAGSISSACSAPGGWASCSRTCRTRAVSPSASRSPPWRRPTTSPWAPHCPLGPVALAACLAVDFVAYNAMIQEQSIGIHYNDGTELLDYVRNKDDFAITDGYIRPLPGPGLGVDVDEEAVIEAARAGCDWKNPVWHHEDGSIAEW